MRPYDEVHFIGQVEMVDHFVSEYPANPSRIPPPGLDFIVYTEWYSLSDHDECALRHSLVLAFGE